MNRTCMEVLIKDAIGEAKVATGNNIIAVAEHGREGNSSWLKMWLNKQKQLKSTLETGEEPLMTRVAVFALLEKFSDQDYFDDFIYLGSLLDAPEVIIFSC